MLRRPTSRTIVLGIACNLPSVVDTNLYSLNIKYGSIQTGIKYIPSSKEINY
jgi:hypothetical protein